MLKNKVAYVGERAFNDGRKKGITDFLKKMKEYGIISTECSFSHLLAYQDGKISEDELWEHIQDDTNVTIERLADELIEKVNFEQRDLNI